MLRAPRELKRTKSASFRVYPLGVWGKNRHIGGMQLPTGPLGQAGIYGFLLTVLLGCAERLGFEMPTSLVLSVAVATFVILLYLVWDNLRSKAVAGTNGKDLGPWDLIIVGLIGIAVSAAITLGGAFWLKNRQPETSSVSALTNSAPPRSPVTLESLEGEPPPAPPAKKYTAYEREARIKAIDSFYPILDEITGVQGDAKNLFANIIQAVQLGTAISQLQYIQQKSETKIIAWIRALERYGPMYPDMNEVLKEDDLNDLVFSIVEASRALWTEIRRIKEMNGGNAKTEDFLTNNIYMFRWETSINNLSGWVEQKRRLLNSKRQEYETAEVYE